MRIGIVAFTERGMRLALSLADGLRSRGNDMQVTGPARLAGAPDIRAYDTLPGWTEQAFANCEALVFVSACGIAVRSIAPFVQDKLHDPAVVCVDEAARHAVALLSGHVGGANALARTIGALCGAEPVITTATDVYGLFAVDEWAARQGLALCDRDAAKRISAHLLEGGTVGLRSDWPIAGAMPDGLVWDDAGACELGMSISFDLGQRPFAHTLRLVPRTVTVGLGCRRGTSAEALAEALDESLTHAHVAREAVGALATIDIKADEEGLRTLADWLGVPLITYTADELASVSGSFSSSPFVLQTVGVDNVCERAACAGGGKLLSGRRTLGGVTVALASEVVRLSFDDGAETAAGGEDA